MAVKVVACLSIILGGTSSALGAQAQEMPTTVQDATLVDVNCVQQTKWRYDGYLLYPAGVETFCVGIWSNGTTTSWTVDGPLLDA